MKLNILLILFLVGSLGFAQDQNKEQLKAEKNATNFIFKANELVGDDNYVEAEMEYRKAISEAPTKAVGAYNLAHSYYKKGSFEEALFRNKEAAKNAITKEEKHRAFHNIGNILMQDEQCKQAVEAFKSALRNNPNDEQTRYNFALAKECAEQQDQDGGGEDDKKDKDKEEEKDKEEDQKKEDENKDKNEKKDDEEKKDEGDQDKKDGDKDKDDEGKPKDDKKDDGKGDKDKKDEKPKPQPGQMSPQQIKNILEAMQNKEQKVQEKMNAEKQKGAKIRTEKDW